MPKKKKRGAGKEKKAKKKTGISEKESLSFELQIVDLNRQLARLRSRNEELETLLEDLTGKFHRLEEDRSDVVAHLKRTLEERIEEARELNERLAALEELRKEELAAFQKKEDAMELEYNTMESNLNAEVKLTAGKLNALEDWRLARLDLMQKFEEQEQQMAEQEQRHKESLYQAEKALIIGKAKMQREMEEHLNDLAQSFREAINIRIADATHRAIRENIALNEELDTMFDICRDLEIKNKEYKDTDQMLRLESELFEAEAKVVLRKTLKQRDVIEKLAEDNAEMILEYGKLQRQNNVLGRQQKLVKEYERRCTDTETRIRIIEQHLEETENEKERILEEMRVSSQVFDKLNRILQDARNVVMESLQLQEQSTEKICSCCCIDVKDRLLRSLLEILNDSDISVNTFSYYKSSKIAAIDCRYQNGNLGFLPSVPSFLDVRKEQPTVTCTGWGSARNESTEDIVNDDDSENKKETRVESSEASVLPSPKESSSAESVDSRKEDRP